MISAPTLSVPGTRKSRDCKGLLTKARPKGQPYKETVDQALLASAFDMKMAREHADSFDKFYRDVTGCWAPTEPAVR